MSKHETGTVTKQTTGAVSKHVTGTVTKQTTDARGGFAGAVSKHVTGTVTIKFVFVLKITLQVEFVFVLQITLPRIHLASLCPGRREVCPRISTPLQHLHEYGI